MPIKSTKLMFGLCAAVLFSGTVIAQDYANEDRFKPRIYGNLNLQPAVNTGITTTRNVVIEPVSTTGTTHVLHSSTANGNYTSADVQAEAKRVIAFQSAAQPAAPVTYGHNFTSERQYQIELFEPAQVQPSYATATTITTPAASQSYATHTVTNAQSHIVSDGDTLYNMAKRYNTSVSALRSANNLTGNNIRIGQNITIPTTARHVISQAPVSAASYGQAPTSNVIRTVQPIPSRGVYAVLPKDTLYSISKRACVTVEGIQAQNNLGQRTNIAPGQRLNMPEGHCLN
jgi:LysM repeat protein